MTVLYDITLIVQSILKALPFYTEGYYSQLTSDFQPAWEGFLE